MVTSVYLLIFFLILAVLLVGYLQINQMKIIERIQQKIFVYYTFEFAEKIPNIDINQVDNHYLPEKINRFFETLNVQKGLSKLLIDIPTATIQIIFGLILLSLYHPLFIVFSLVLVAILWVIFKITGQKGLKTSIEESNNKYEVVAWLEDLGRVIKSFKHSQGTNLNLIKTDEKTIKYLESRTSHFKVLLFQFKSLIFFKTTITALMLILGTYLLFEQKINVGQFVAAEIVIITIINAIEKTISSLENVYDVATGLYKLDSILDFQNETTGGIELISDEINVEIKDMSFSYNDKDILFKNLSLKIPSNAITVITGEENSGKSSFLRLLSGAYNNYSGSINFNNIPLQNYSLKSIRSNMGILLYDKDIFEGSLYENVTLGRDNIDINHILKVAKEIGIENFITFFPKSFNTKIEPLGRKLPNSLIKKILLLRALINNPKILILEEPWAGFDNETKINVQEYLMRNAKYRTIIISTNDDEFIKKCNSSFKIINGTVLNLRNDE